MGLVSISLPILLIFSIVSGHEYIDIAELDHHPMILEAEESTVECPANIDPNSYWMKKFLKLIKENNFPEQAVSWEALRPNLRLLAELEQKGYLQAIAKGDYDPKDIEWPDPALKPLIIPTYMPVVTPPQPEPVIVLEQIWDGKKVFKEVIGQQTRKKRNADGTEYEELEPAKRRAFHVDPSHFNENLPFISEEEHEIHEPEFDDDGQIIGRKKRDTPDNMMVWPPPGTLFTVKRLCVAAHTNGTIIQPDD